MAKTLNQIKYEALLLETGLPGGKLNELEHAWLVGKGATPASINEMWIDLLAQQGHTGNLSEMQYDALAGQGYEGSLNEKFYQYWTDLAGGGGNRFVATSAEYQDGVVVVYTNQVASVFTAAGWSMTVEGAGQALVADSINGYQLIFTTSPDIPIGANVLISYDDTTGATSSGGVELDPFTDVKVNEGPGELAFGAAGSLYMLTDGVIQNHALGDVVTGFRPVNYNTPSGLAIPDHENSYFQMKSGEAPWYGARRVTNYCRQSSNPTATSVWATRNVIWTDTGDGYIYELGGTTGRLVSQNMSGSGAGLSVGSSKHVLTLEVTALVDTEITFRVGSATVNDAVVPITVAEGRQRICTPVIPNDFGGQEIAYFDNTGGIGQRFIIHNVTFERVELQSNQAPGENIVTGASVETRLYSNLNGNTLVAQGTGFKVVEAAGAALDPLPALYFAKAVTSRQYNSYGLNAWVGDTVNTLIAGMYGTTDSGMRVDDQNATSQSKRTQQMTGFVAGGPHTSRWVIRKDTNQTRFPLFGNHESAQSNNRYMIRIDTQTGAVYERITEASGRYKVVDTPAYWIVYIESQDAGSNTSFATEVYPAQDSVLTNPTGDSSATGSIDLYNVDSYDATIEQVEAYPIITSLGDATTIGPNYADYPVENHADDQGAYYCEATLLENNGGSDSLLGVGTSGRLMYWSAIANQNSFDGTNARTVASPWVNGTWKKLGNAYGAVDGLNRLTVDGVSQEGAYDGSWNPTLLRAGGYHAITSGRVNSIALIRNIRRYNLPYADAKLKIDELIPPVP